MSGIPLHDTRMGHTYYEHTLPELVRQLTRLNDLLERLAAALAPAPDRPREAKEATGK